MSSANTGLEAGDEESAFGFRKVAAGTRQGLVNEVFSAVAGRYDLMNDLMSGGLHRLWKDDLITWLNPPRSARRFELIDVAAGTGDIALKALAGGGPGCKATLLDINLAMLEVGRSRIRQAGLAAHAVFSIGNAEALPFADQQFDAFTVGFGIRNVTHIDRALSEAYRVLRPGGRFLCLEFSCCEVPVLDRLYDFHSFEVIPRLGALAAGAAEPYRYLVESIRAFPDQRRFAAMIGAAGFARVSFRNLTGGIAAMHSGWRL
ncbi:MAG TPA: bifunctional demethylmenaquinone methyltransferase/2-methoxy-6-polyprenyl-1,4-benzoquinol methylase UbiE [Hyphomicrobiaceae bacterium]|jgi:demethylmenaquinone methyltransferase/2-methoxy-6-polyprenyl-1,4-benzoquinol methylase|nr:bifunctional demethylmenaquinone methyltransferase/2-methoxy-6-polyprenyl-1,4-benzoquinol methylase UbiE [Hyphomicrobiaceae bacterium]